MWITFWIKLEEKQRKNDKNHYKKSMIERK